jgi:polyisoprenoid-binding protein YceI
MFARHVRCWIGLLTLSACLGVGARATPARAAEPAAAYDVDVEASRIYVKVGTATRLGHQHGVEGKLKSGKLTFGGEGELVIDMASFTADTAAARKRVGLEDKKVTETEAKTVTETMRGERVLDVDKYPTATFQIASITPLDKQAPGRPGDYELEGRFTLHGVERKLHFKAKLEPADKPNVLRFTGTFTIRQTDHGIKPITAVGGLSKVADELEMAGELFLRPPAAK